MSGSLGLRVILIGALVTDIVLVVQVLGVLSGMVLGLLAVNEVQPLGLNQLVNLGAGKADKELFGELVADWLACESVSGLLHHTISSGGWARTLLALVIFEYLHSTERRGTGKGFVAEARLVVLEVIAIDLVVGVLRISCWWGD